MSQDVTRRYGEAFLQSLNNGGTTVSAGQVVSQMDLIGAVAILLALGIWWIRW